MFLNNKYTKWYFNIIDVAKSRNSINEYVERHHIIPKCMGGSDMADNLIKLSAREHFICHWLLTKMTEGSQKYKMMYALNGMKRTSKGQNRYITKITSRVYDSIRQSIKELIASNAKGKAPAIDSMTREAIGKISIDDPRWSTGEIVGHTSGRPGTMIGKHAAKLSISGVHIGAVSLSDCRWSTGEIVSVRKGSNLTSTHKQNLGLSRKEGLSDGTIIPWNKDLKTGKNTLGGTATAKDGKTGEILGRISINDIRWSTKEIVGIRKII